jgi:hypothetical protein
MIQDAEQNALLDKSKKSLVNITYELDNLLFKMQKATGLIGSSSSDPQKLFALLYKQLISAYSENKFKLIQSKTLKDLRYATNILVFELIKKEISKNGNKNQASGNVIDVDLAED